jgi:CBS domain-containing protein
MTSTFVPRRPEAGGPAARPSPTVADAMITDVKIHDARATVGQLRQFFADGHVHAAVIVERGVLLAVVDRADVHEGLGDDVLAVVLGPDASRVVAPDTDLEHARELLLGTGRRRLAVADPDGRLRGLLCLKRTRIGFCSARDVRARATALGVAAPHL